MKWSSSYRKDEMEQEKKDTTKDAILAELEKLGGKLTTEEDVVFQGKKLVVPETMDLREAVRFLELKIEEDEEEITFSKVFNYRAWDGARATGYALKKAFGMTRQTPTYSFFGKNPPQMITVKVGVNEEEQVPWGNIVVPALPEMVLTLSVTRHKELGQLFAVTATGPKKYRFHIQGIFTLIEEELNNNSMYRGKAFDGQDQAEFLDLSGVDPAKVVYSDDVMTQLEANVWSLMRYTEKMRELKVPLKRAVLFEGPFGTGKTLGAYLTAKVAVENGWTFIFCRPGRDRLRDAMNTARLYQPSVVFFEDVDVVAEGDGSSDAVTELLDLFDGLQAKNTEIVCVLTTNHVERIHKGMVRPGRLDSVIHIGALDHSGIKRMIWSSVAEEMIDEFTDWDKVCVSMEGFLPAFCKEAIDRTVRYNLSRNGGVVTTLTTEDFVEAANGLRPQLRLMEEAGEGGKENRIEDAIARTVKETVRGTAIVRDGYNVDEDVWARLDFEDDNSDS